MRYKSVYALIHGFANLPNAERFTAEAKLGNVFFRQGTLYSYGHHFPLAKYVQTKKHGVVVLINTDSYSITTSSHQSTTRGALTHRECIFVGLGEYNEPRNIFQRFESQTRGFLNSLEKARKPEKYLAEIAGLRSNAEEYARLTGEKIPKILAGLFAVTDKDEYVKIRWQESRDQEKANKATQVERARQDAENLTA